MFRYQIIALLCTITLGSDCFAQASVKDSSIAAPMINASLGLHLPGRDMANRFGSSSAIGGGFMHKTRTSWIFGFETQFLSGNDIREEGILDPISTTPDADGNRYVIDGNGTYAELFMYERGYTMTAKAGYVLPVIGPNPNSGLVVMMGVGFMQHKIRIEVRDNTAPQLKGDLKKGYDRLSNGLLYSQFVGYLHMGNKSLVNFFAGLEALEGFTSNRRSVNYDTGLHDDTKRLDVLYGVKVGWIFPLYARVPEKRYYY